MSLGPAPPAARTLGSTHRWCWDVGVGQGILSPPLPPRLLEHCRKHKYLSSSGEVFALLVSSLLVNLLDYRTIIMHDESKENRMSCTVNVLVCTTPLGPPEGSPGAPDCTALSKHGRHEAPPYQPF